MVEVPWITLEQVAPMFGVSFETAKNKIALGTFPIKTYKVGRKIVADRQVVDSYFAAQREKGLAALKSTTVG